MFQLNISHLETIHVWVFCFTRKTRFIIWHHSFISYAILQLIHTIFVFADLFDTVFLVVTAAHKLHMDNSHQAKSKRNFIARKTNAKGDKADKMVITQ